MIDLSLRCERILSADKVISSAHDSMLTLQTNPSGQVCPVQHHLLAILNTTSTSQTAAHPAHSLHNHNHCYHHSCSKSGQYYFSLRLGLHYSGKSVSLVLNKINDTFLKTSLLVYLTRL
jgi:hypothetical protein